MRSLAKVMVLGLVLAAAAPALEAVSPAIGGPLVSDAEAQVKRKGSTSRSSGGGSGGKADQAGEALGELITGWGSAILLAVAGILGIAALAKRDVGMAFGILVICIVIGGFLFGQEQMKGLITAIWERIA